MDCEKFPLKQTRKFFLEIGKQLHSAFSNCGFVYLLDHGVPEDLVDSIFKTSRDFFEQEQSLKDKYPWNPKTTCGYVPPDAEKLDALREDQDSEQVR